MSRSWPETFADGSYSLLGGMNSGQAPSSLPPTQCALAVNTTFRGGLCGQTRPKFMKINLNFQGNSDAESWFYDNYISGQAYFQPNNGTAQLVCCAGGRFFAFVFSGYDATVVEFTPQDGPNDIYYSRTWFCQAANYLVAQNGIDKPVIFNGSTGTRSNIADNQVPVGKQMVYINNRLFVVAPNGRQIFPGDLAYSTPDSVITFTEINESASIGGQPLGIPMELGGITGIVATAQQDTQTGQGSLLVATNRGVSSINAIVQRSQWPNIQLQNVALVGNGFTSDGLAVVNGDVWGRSVDGYRSYIMARRDFSSWGNTPQSREMQRLIDADDRALLQYSSIAYFDNRLLMTTSPVPWGNGLGAYHKGIIALNFDNISSITSKSAPAYDGLWTGINPYGFTVGEFSNRQRCFAFCHTENGNELWEITTEQGDDNDETPIQCLQETRSFSFNSIPSNIPLLKGIDSAEIFVDELYDDVSFDLKYRPNQYPCWLDWYSWSACAAKRDCNASSFIDHVCSLPQFTERGYRPRMVIGQPPPQIDPVLNTTQNIAYEFSLRLAWTGQARIRSILLYASKRDVNTQLEASNV